MLYFVTLSLPFCIHRGSKSTSIESAMLNCYEQTDEPNTVSREGLLLFFFFFSSCFAVTMGSPTGKGEERGIQLVTISNLTTRCQ